MSTYLTALPITHKHTIKVYAHLNTNRKRAHYLNPHRIVTPELFTSMYTKKASLFASVHELGAATFS